ncbi:MAG: flagellar motor protein MotB [Pirellula sp.]
MSGSGGSWKVAYADFVTAMMAFFMVMWLTSQKPEVRKAVADHFKNPGGKRLTGNDAQSLIPSNNSGNGNRRVQKARGQKKSDGDAKVRKMTDEGDKSNVGTVVNFAVNSVELTDEGRDVLQDLLPQLQGKQHILELRGHSASTGGNTLQSSLDAWQISSRRALAVAQYLMENNIDSRRIRLSQAGFADPKYNAEEIDHTQDSRVEVFVLSDLFEEPSAKAERMVSVKTLDAKAKALEAKDKAAAAATPAAAPPKGGH